jgi:hypothetical protein
MSKCNARYRHFKMVKTAGKITGMMLGVAFVVVASPLVVAYVVKKGHDAYKTKHNGKGRETPCP